MPLLNPFGVYNASHFFFGLHPELFKFISHHRVLSFGFKWEAEPHSLREGAEPHHEIYFNPITRYILTPSRDIF